MKLTSLFILLIFANVLQAQMPNTWTLKTPFPIERLRTTCFAINGKAYLALGRSAPGQYHSRAVWEYNPDNNSWTEKNNFPGPKSGYGTSFVIGNKGYYICGSIDTATTGTSTALLSSAVYEYDPSTDTWTQKADFPGQARRLAAGFSINGKGYIATGINNPWGSYNSGSGTVMLNDMWEYNPQNDTWIQKANILGLGRYISRVTVINDKAYLYGGRHNASDLNDFQCYDPQTDTWTLKTSPPTPSRYCPVMFTLEGNAFLGTGSYNFTYNNAFWEYNSQSDSWRTTAPIPFTRDLAECFTLGSRGFVGGGGGLQNSDSVRKSFYEYTPPSTNTIQFKQYKIDFCRYSSPSIGYSLSGSFNPGNVFNIEISDITGSFSSATIIGTVQSNQGGFINVSFPSGTNQGKYKIRMTSSAPQTIGDTLTIRIHNTFSGQAQAYFCSASSGYYWGDTLLQSAGTYQRTFLSDYGCDSTVTLTLTEELSPLPPLITDDTIKYCKGTTAQGLSAVGTNLLWYETINGTPSGQTPTPGTALVGTKAWYVSQSNAFCESLKDSIVVQIMSLPAPVIQQLPENSLQTGSFTGYQWYKNEAAIPNATNALYIPSENGLYKVAVTDEFGCEGMSAPFNFVPTSATDVTNGMKVTIYPNPFRDQITLDNLKKNYAFNLYNLLGEKIVTGSVNATKNQIDCRQLSSGLYILGLTDQTTNRTNYFKIIKIQ